MLKAIFWKEWRQQRIFLLTIVVFLPMLVALLLWVGGSFADERLSVWDKLGMAALSVAVLQAMVTGSLLFAGEVESGTLEFLDACSAERSRIWRAKMGSALVIALPAALLPALCGGVEALPLTVFAIETLLVTAACSVFVRTTFRALGAAVLALFIMSYVVALLGGARYAARMG
jgi:ABC-type transport system involved in multi-copper enzyme maturation permease subunit